MNYDIIVIGAGSGGLNIASFMNKLQFKVLLIDKSDNSIGGDCLNFGCVPSKALIHLARMAHHARTMQEYGLHVKGSVDLKNVMAYVLQKQDVIRKHENADYFRKQGIDVVLGSAQFSGRQTVTVNGKEYTGKNIVIATGSRPRKLKLPGVENVNVQTNETIFSVQKLPKKMVVVGGGPIGIELGQAFQHLGSRVCVIQRGPTFLPKERPDIARVLQQQLEKDGMQFFFDASPVRFPTAKSVVVKLKDGKEKTLQFDLLLVSIGRELNLDISLDKAGIAVDERGRIIVNDRLQTTNKHVFVVGDAAGQYQFTHAAELHASVVLHNFFSPKKKNVNYDAFAWVTYTTPEIATWGLQEGELKKRGIPYQVKTLNFQHDDRAIVDDAVEGKVVVYVHKDRILGGSMVTPHAGELFQELVLATSAKLSLNALFNKVYPYPTASRINKRLAAEHYSGKLSKTAKAILRWLY